MVKVKLYKIVLILVMLFCVLGIGDIYSSIFGNPIVKLIANDNIKRYIKIKYPEIYSLGKVGYNFKNKEYLTELLDSNKKSIGILGYYNHVISDSKEEEILKDKLNKKIDSLLKKSGFKFDDLVCDTYVSINANQRFDSIGSLDSYNSAYITINQKNEISKDAFAEMVLDIIPEIKTILCYKKGSEIAITYVFDKEDEFHRIKFFVKDSDAKLTKEYIVKNTVIVTY